MVKWDIRPVFSSVYHNKMRIYSWFAKCAVGHLAEVVQNGIFEKWNSHGDSGKKKENCVFHQSLSEVNICKYNVASFVESFTYPYFSRSIDLWLSYVYAVNSCLVRQRMWAVDVQEDNCSISCCWFQKCHLRHSQRILFPTQGRRTAPLNVASIKDDKREFILRVCERKHQQWGIRKWL